MAQRVDGDSIDGGSFTVLDLAEIRKNKIIGRVDIFSALLNFGE
jgi:hypothetical protein